MVRRGGFEPPHPKAQRPQRCVSTVPPPAHIKSGIKCPTQKELNRGLLNFIVKRLT